MKKVKISLFILLITAVAVTANWHDIKNKKSCSHSKKMFGKAAKCPVKPHDKAIGSRTPLNKKYRGSRPQMKPRS